MGGVEWGGRVQEVGRSGRSFGGHSEQENTLNQLLVEMDGQWGAGEGEGEVGGGVGGSGWADGGWMHKVTDLNTAALNAKR